MLVKTNAIVLHSFKYGESKLIVDLFTETQGRLGCIVRVAKSATGKLKKQYFQPLSLLEVIVDVRQRARLQTIKDARVAVPFVSIPFNPYKLSISLFVAEFLCGATQREEADQPLYTYIYNSICWLDNCEHKFANFHLVFAMRLTRFLGFYPNLDDYQAGCWFDLRASCFCLSAPLHRDGLPPKEARLIQLMMRMNFSTMHLYRMNRNERNRLLDIILEYYRLHVPDFPQLKSVSVLKEVMAV